MSFWIIGYAHLTGFKIWDKPVHPAFGWTHDETAKEVRSNDRDRKVQGAAGDTAH